MINVLKTIKDNQGTISTGIHNNWAKFDRSENAYGAKQKIDNSKCYITGNIENKNNRYSFEYVLKQKSL